jgi:hypothetical protein
MVDLGKLIASARMVGRRPRSGTGLLMISALTRAGGRVSRYRFDPKGQAYDFNVLLVEWKDGKSVVKRRAQIAKQ